MQKKIIILSLITLAVTFAPLSVHAFSLVPCGSSEYPEPCQLKHLIILITRVINYLITVAAIVAMYYILLAGFNLITSVGNAEKIEKARKGLSNAIVGFGIIVLAFVFVNLLVNGIFGKGEKMERKWYDIQCIYNPGATDCPFNPSNPINQ